MQDARNLRAAAGAAAHRKHISCESARPGPGPPPTAARWIRLPPGRR